MARRAVEEKAEQLALTSKYKTEFLANMSHELRTPLNSLLILSKLLADNQQGNLNEKQTEFARTIHWRRHRPAQPDQRHPRSVEDRIGHGVDRARRHADGRAQAAHGAHLPPARLGKGPRRSRSTSSDELPATIRTDEKRLQQVVLNLLSNAFKFTAEGGVTLAVRAATGGWSANHPVLQRRRDARSKSRSPTPASAFPQDKQKLIFEAFQQADGTTSRKYGGTGLGLSISREIARLLGGELQVRSTPGEGSTFTLYVPLQVAGRRSSRCPRRRRRPRSTTATPVTSALPIADDRDELDGEPFVLIVEDDPTFAAILLDLAHEAGLKGVISSAGSGTVAMVRKMRPTRSRSTSACPTSTASCCSTCCATIPRPQHIPVHVISGAEQAAHALTLGAAGGDREAGRPRRAGEAVRVDRRSRARQPQDAARRPSASPPRPSRGAVPELAGTQDPHHRRRHPQHLLADQRARERTTSKVLHAERGAEGIAHPRDRRRRSTSRWSTS